MKAERPAFEWVEEEGERLLYIRDQREGLVVLDAKQYDALMGFLWSTEIERTRPTSP